MEIPREINIDKFVEIVAEAQRHLICDNWSGNDFDVAIKSAKESLGKYYLIDLG